MNEKTRAQEVIEEIKNADEKTLRSTIEKWYESTRMDGIRLGAVYISAAVRGAIEKNLKKGKNSSLRDYQRAIKRIIEIVSVQLEPQETQQNDLEEAAEGDEA